MLVHIGSQEIEESCLSITNEESISGVAGSIATVYSKHIIMASRTFRETVFVLSLPLPRTTTGRLFNPNIFHNLEKNKKTIWFQIHYNLKINISKLKIILKYKSFIYSLNVLLIYVYNNKSYKSSLFDNIFYYTLFIIKIMFLFSGLDASNPFTFHERLRKAFNSFLQANVHEYDNIVLCDNDNLVTDCGQPDSR